MDSDSRRGDAARARSTRGAMRGALAALVGALAASRIARASSQGVETPPLNAHVSARARVASAGMDPNIEATAAAWFANLGFRVLEGATATTRGAWGGTARESDARFATSYCLDASTNTSALEDYDFVGWLPVSNAIEDVMSDRVDFKVVLFETMATEWWEHAGTRADAARGRRGRRRRRVGTRIIIIAIFIRACGSARSGARRRTRRRGRPSTSSACARSNPPRRRGVY